MDKGKRDRSANFSLHERDILVSLVQKYQTVLENKQSDASTWKMKEAAWESIQNEFNARSGGTFRSTKTLKVKYEGLKRTVRKKSAAIRSELYRTGGGKNTAPSLDSVEEQIKAMISLSTDGMRSIYDSDILPQTEENQDSIEVPKMDEFTGISLLDMDIPEAVESEATQNQVLLLVTNECEPLPSTSTSTDTVPVEKNIILENVNDIVLLDTPTRKCLKTPSSENKKWDVTSRRNLKSRKHPALIANVPKKTLFDELTQAKLELVELQKKFLEEEIIQKKKAWEFEENERKKEAELKEKQAKLELVEIKKKNLVEIIEKKKAWEFEENERKKEAELKEKQAKLELVEIQKKILEEEFIAKKKVWEFEENERKKEAEFKENERKKEADFKEKERQWKEAEYKLKLKNNFK